jgi:hypothetical protein
MRIRNRSIARVQSAQAAGPLRAISKARRPQVRCARSAKRAGRRSVARDQQSAQAAGPLRAINESAQAAGPLRAINQSAQAAGPLRAINESVD